MGGNVVKRHLWKTVTWRVVGTIDTIILSSMVSGNLVFGLKIGFLEIISKMLLYYVHERLWFNVNIRNTNIRHFFKTFSWRFVGTLDTISLAWIITGNPLLGLQIGFFEVITKMVLYYLHEKIWYKSNFGLEKLRGLNSEQKHCST